MITDEIKYRILNEFAFTPTPEQNVAIGRFADFAADRRNNCVMVLRGSAGTGKTALAGAIVRAMQKLKQRVVLMAPTGRAAKMFALNAGAMAFTIHRRIYREGAFQGNDSKFSLNNNLYRDTLFVVDEASMIANENAQETPFGSGRLLDDLIRYVYQGSNCRLMLIGDKAQLPPVGEDESPALSSEVLRAYSLKVYEADMNAVLRQHEGSGILYNATVIRKMITHDGVTGLPKIRFSGFADIANVPGNELIEQLASSYASVGQDETIVITRSNKRANIYNQGIRRTVLDREDMLSGGDMLIVVKNKYYTVDGHDEFVANGDRAVVRRVHNTRELYGFHFADLDLEFPDYDNRQMSFTTILDTLTSEQAALSREQSDKLMSAVMEDYADLPLKKDRYKGVREDQYYNALQVKFAYAVTCHKAQGGQWQHVYVDQGYMTDDMLTPDYIHWLYTAFTRATDKLFLVNWPKTQTEGGATE